MIELQKQPTIKFSHKYWKMPLHYNPSVLLEILNADSSQFSKHFAEYDTAIVDGGYYPLPKGKVIVLILKTLNGHLWTTIRRQTESKERYYRNLRGRVCKITITQPLPKVDGDELSDKDRAFIRGGAGSKLGNEPTR